MTLFDAARARSSDPETSHEAAASVRHLRESERAVLRVLNRLGSATDERIADEYEMIRYHWGLPYQSPSGLRTRRSALVDMGRVEFAGEYGRTASGRRTRIWRAT